MIKHIVIKTTIQQLFVEKYSLYITRPYSNKTTKFGTFDSMWRAQSFLDPERTRYVGDNKWVGSSGSIYTIKKEVCAV
jgi:hypothetical protein